MGRSRSAAPHPLVVHALVERRAFIRGAVAGALLAGGAGSLLSACSSSGGTASGGAPTGSVAPGTTLGPLPYDPEVPYWMQGGFAPVAEEVHAVDLAVTGALPPELDGLYVRNGSNPANGPSPHWFLGDGMVHGVRLSGGKARWYRNRYVDTPLYRNGTGILPDGGSGGGSGGAPGGASNQSNVSVFHHAGRLLSSGEIGLPYELSTEDLATVGPYDFGGKLTTSMTAHPKIDPATGKLHFFGYGFVPPFLTYHVAAADGTLEYRGEIAVAGPTMIHDFAITDRDAVFWEMPVVFDLNQAVAAVTGKGEGLFPFRWDPSYGARIGIMPLGGPVEAIRWVEIDPCFVFHGVNAFRDGDTVVLDVCRLPAVFQEGGDDGTSTPRRWRIDTSGPNLTFSEEVLSDDPMDLPAIDRRFTGRSNRHAWYLRTESLDGSPVEFKGLWHRDDTTGKFDIYSPGPGLRVNEATFVPAGTGEGEGWLVTYAWDRARGATDLLVLDALDLVKGPVARVHLPTRVPYGFHGWWVPAQA
jgi:carotenoid cleavage dioxygenase-like enzyme